VIRKPTYDPFKDGNVFYWILSAAESFRELRRAENHAIKEAAAKSKRLDRAEMAYQKW
jgi:hypothetical protein